MKDRVGNTEFIDDVQSSAAHKKQELEKMCEKCHRKMSVKFDFNKMETEGDPEAWVVFNCSMCATPEAGHSDGDDSSGYVLKIVTYSLCSRNFQNVNLRLAFVEI